MEKRKREQQNNDQQAFNRTGKRYEDILNTVRKKEKEHSKEGKKNTQTPQQ